MLIIDVETRSKVDLLTAGAYNYAFDPSTELICIAFDLNGFKHVVYSFEQLPVKIVDYIKHRKGLIGAFNANFERLIWEALAPDHLQVPLAMWYCISAECRVNALPQALNPAHRAITGQWGKDVRGPQLIKLLSVPMEDGTFRKDPHLIREMGAYCSQDVAAAVEVHNHCRSMTSTEHSDWLINEIINDNGVEIDTLLAQNAVKYAEIESRDMASRLEELTEGAVGKTTQIQRIKKWVHPRLESNIRKRVMRDGKLVLDKGSRQILLTGDAEGAFKLPPNVREVIEILDEGNKSSVAKFQQMLDRADPEDDRVRGAFIYAGAAQTLRFSSRGLQLHNFRRDCFSPLETEEWITEMESDFAAPGMDDLSKMLRPALVPSDGCVFVVGDWSQIEARALPWLAIPWDANAEDDDPQAVMERLNIFRAKDADPNAPDMYTITANELGLGDRQIGKVAELALGYGGGQGAFQSMAQLYGVRKTTGEVEDIVQNWRVANQWAVNFWDALEAAAKEAKRKPGEEISAGKVKYQYNEKLLDGTLICTLPGGTVIQYPKCKTSDSGELSALKANWSPAAGEKEWPRVSLWRGLLAENVTQAFCASLLRAALRECDKRNLMVVGHVHDEIIVECQWKDRKWMPEKLREIMEREYGWTRGLPLNAEPSVMTRYGK